MGQYKYQYSNGIIFFEGRDVALLEKAALEGWHLRDMNRLGFYRLERGEPRPATYAIDVNKIKTCSGEFEAYRALFEGGGWRYVFSIEDTFHFFTAPKGTTPIYTDAGSESAKFQRASRHCAVVTGVLLLLGVPVLLACFLLSPLFPLHIAFGAVGGGLLGLALAHLAALVLNMVRAARAK